MDKSKWGVHERHCCPIHGCKYGDNECPVSTYKISAESMCEDCQDMWADYDDYDIITNKGSKHYYGYKEFFEALNTIISWGEGHTIVDLRANISRTISLKNKGV